MGVSGCHFPDNILTTNPEEQMTATRPTEGCRSESCLFERALSAVTVPVFMQDETRLLFANRAAALVMGGAGDEDFAGRDSNDFLHADSVEASLQRRRLAIKHGASLRGIPIKGRMLDGTVRRAVTDGERISFSGDGTALVHILREVDGQPLLRFRAPSRIPGSSLGSQANCIHEAAFEALPAAVAIHDDTCFVAVNAQGRRIVGGDPSGLAPDAVTHADSALAGAERRRITLGDGHTLRNVEVKLRGLHDRTLYVCLDVEPIEHDGRRLLVLTIKEARY